MSIGPENGIEMRGWTLKPSSVLRTSMSAQSDGRAAQSGFGRSTRRPVSWVRSEVVKRLLGNGWPALSRGEVALRQETAAYEHRRDVDLLDGTYVLSVGPV